MKKFFTLVAAAAVVSTAAAAPVFGAFDAHSGKGELSEYGKHKLLTTAAQFEADRIAGIERPGTIHRSFQQGQILWDIQMVLTGPLGEYFTAKPSMEDVPLYGVEYVLTGENINTGATVTFLPVLLAYPTKYMEQIRDWNGPLETFTNPETGKQYQDIPVDMRDFEAVPLTEFVEKQEYWMPRFWDANGFFYLTVAVDESTLPDTCMWPGPFAWGMWGFSGGYLNGTTKYVTLKSDFDIDKNQNGECTKIQFQDYSPDDDFFSVSNDYYLQYCDKDYQKPAGGTTKFSLDYEGTAAIQGFIAKDMFVDMSEVHIFNAGLLDPEEMGDNWPFLGWTEEPLQLFYMMMVNDEGTIGQNQEQVNATQKDPTFSKDKVGFYLATADSDPEEVKFAYGYLFSKKDTEDLTNSQWNFLPATEYTYDDYGNTVTVYDYLDPTPDTFVSPREYSKPNVASAWSREYGMAYVSNGYVHWPDTSDKSKSRGVIATSTEEGILYNFYDTYGNHVKLNSTNRIQFHYNYNDMTMVKEVDCIGDFAPEYGDNWKDPEGAVNTMKAPMAAKVSARNGKISIAADQAANVQVYNLNGQLVKAADLKAGNSINVNVEKGLYIVRVNNNVTKVIL